MIVEAVFYWREILPLSILLHQGIVGDIQVGM